MNMIIWMAMIIGGFGILLGVCLSMGNKKLEQLQRYWDIEIGMSEAEMLNIMGG